MPKFEMDRGQPGILFDLNGLSIPALDNFAYETHAPYDALQSQPTLLLNRFTGAIQKHPALTIVSLVPGESVTATSLIERLAPQVVVGDSSRIYKASAPISQIDISATKDTTTISFLGNDGEAVDIDGFLEESAIVTAKGLLFAVQNKLAIKKGSGFKFDKP